MRKVKIGEFGHSGRGEFATMLCKQLVRDRCVGAAGDLDAAEIGAVEIYTGRLREGVHARPAAGEERAVDVKKQEFLFQSGAHCSERVAME